MRKFLLVAAVLGGATATVGWLDRDHVVPPGPVAVSHAQVGEGPEATRRAVILLHGLRGTTVLDRQAHETWLHDWQREGSDLVQALARDADVYAVSYTQNAAIEDVLASEALGQALGTLAGGDHDDVVLLGHSAGGLLARRFVEDHPDAGVTGVVQLCAPNAGSGWGRFHEVGRASHEAFIASLSDEALEAARRRPSVPEDVDFLVVVCDGTGLGDGVVADDAQWPEDLQRQGIAAVRIRALHFTATRGERMAERIAAWVAADHPRLGEAEIAETRREVLGRGR